MVFWQPGSVVLYYVINYLYFCLSQINFFFFFFSRVDQSKTVQAKITKSSPSAAWKTLVSGIGKLFHKFERGLPKLRR